LSVPINPTLINYYRNAEASRMYRIMKNKSVTFLQIEINFHEIRKIYFNVSFNINSIYIHNDYIYDFIFLRHSQMLFYILDSLFIRKNSFTEVKLSKNFDKCRFKNNFIGLSK